MQKISERMKVAEDRISAVEDRVPVLSKDLKAVSQTVQALLTKVDDLENRSRRNHLLPVPWLRNTFNPAVLSPFFAIKRAHRVPTRPRSLLGPLLGLFS